MKNVNSAKLKKVRVNLKIKENERNDLIQNLMDKS